MYIKPIKEEYKTPYFNIYRCMCDGFNLKTIVKKTGYSKSYILEILKSHAFDIYVIGTNKLNEIYSIPDENEMEKALELLTLQLDNNHPSLYPCDSDRDGYFYVRGCWVKKDWRGRDVRRIEKMIIPPHAKSEWCSKLRIKFGDIWRKRAEDWLATHQK